MARGRRTYSDRQLEAAVAQSRTMADVLRALSLFPGGGNYESVKKRMRHLGLDVPRSRTLCSFAREALAEAVEGARSYAEVLRILGISSGGNQGRLKERLLTLGIDTSHFLGARWRRGVKTPVVRRRVLSELLVKGRLVPTNGLKRRLLEEGLKQPRCERCSRDTWNGLPIPLELDHVNGHREDNRLENLRILCPNCHAQTATYCGRNIGSAS